MVEWIEPPPQEVKAEAHFNVTYELVLTSAFFQWAVKEVDTFKMNIFNNANFTGIT